MHDGPLFRDRPLLPRVSTCVISPARVAYASRDLLSGHKYVCAHIHPSLHWRMCHFPPAPTLWRLVRLLLCRVLSVVRVVLLELCYFPCRSLPYPCVERCVQHRHKNNLKKGRRHAENFRHFTPFLCHCVSGGAQAWKSSSERRSYANIILALLCPCVTASRVAHERRKSFHNERAHSKIFGVPHLCANVCWWRSGV